MVDRVSVLFVGTGSLTAEEVVAVRVAVPGVNAVVVTWNFMSAPLARLAMVMMSCPLEKVTPVGTVVTCRSDGRVRIAWTLVAVFGPKVLGRHSVHGGAVGLHRCRTGEDHLHVGGRRWEPTR